MIVFTIGDDGRKNCLSVNVDITCVVVFSVDSNVQASRIIEMSVADLFLKS